MFLGRLEDLAGASEMQVPVAGAASLEAVIGRLPARLAAALAEPRIRVAINGELVGACREAGAMTISDCDELAFLPPVSGG